MARLICWGLALLALPFVLQAVRSEKQKPVNGGSPTDEVQTAKPAAPDGDTCEFYSISELGDDPDIGNWIAKTIPEVIEVGSWGDRPCASVYKRIVKYYGPKKILVVCHTPAVQAKVKGFLKELKEAFPLNERTYSLPEKKIKPTGNPLDFAIEGDGFFRLTLPGGTVCYTRDARFTLSANGQIVNANGFNLEPAITLPQDTLAITIGTDGKVSVITVEAPNVVNQVGEIKLARFINPAGLTAVGNNLFLESSASGAPIVSNPGQDGNGILQQFFLESSKVEVATAAAPPKSGVVQADYRSPDVLKISNSVPEQSYPVPAPARPPKHLFHYIIRYEGAGIIDSNVAKLVKALNEEKGKTATDPEADQKEKQDKKEKKAQESPKKTAKDAGVVPATYTVPAGASPGLLKASNPLSEPNYPVPAPACQPKHLFHLIIRYEGAGIIDSNVAKVIQAQAGEKDKSATSGVGGATSVLIGAAQAEKKEKQDQKEKEPASMTSGSGPTMAGYSTPGSPAPAPYPTAEPPPGSASSRVGSGYKEQKKDKEISPSPPTDKEEKPSVLPKADKEEGKGPVAEEETQDEVENENIEP